jgi:hypothetical protein
MLEMLSLISLFFPSTNFHTRGNDSCFLKSTPFVIFPAFHHLHALLSGTSPEIAHTQQPIQDTSISLFYSLHHSIPLCFVAIQRKRTLNLEASTVNLMASAAAVDRK